MSDIAVKTYENFELPSNIVSRADLSRLVSELEFVDNELNAARIRASGREVAAPAVSESLEAFLSQNGLTLGDDRVRVELIKQTRILKDTAPVIHLTFAVPADRISLQQIAQWLRRNVHAQTVITVGLQPSLVAGVYVRTPNHVHDLSVRAALANSRGVLVKELEALRGAN